MQKRKLLWVGVILWLLPALGKAEPPREIGGFVLGADIAGYRERVVAASTLPVRHLECLQEVEVQPIAGFKSGLIAYGGCAEKDRILRIKLKYADASKAFYDKLLARFKQRFGKPDEWRGDPFQIFIAWKWSFAEDPNNRTSLILQHNTQNSEEKLGNTVKMSLTSALERERLCFKRQSGASSPKRDSSADKGSGSPDWDRLIPR